MRKFFIIVIVIIIIIIASWLGYLVWKKLNSVDVVTEQKLKTEAEIKKTAGSSSLNLITENSIANFWVNASSGEVFLINYNGKIEKLENLKTKTLASNNGLKNISQVIPSPDGSRALINLTIYETINNLWTPLPAGATAAAWHPNNLPIISYLTNDGLYNLNLKDGKTSLVLKLNNRDWQMEWLTVNEIYLKSRPTPVLNQEIWKVNLKDRTITRSTAPISFKCFNSYCAKPTNQVVDNLFLDNYFKRKIYTNDSIYFGSKLLLRADEQNPIDATNLSLYKDKLLFINRYDQKLYSLELK